MKSTLLLLLLTFCFLYSGLTSSAQEVKGDSTQQKRRVLIFDSKGQINNTEVESQLKMLESLKAAQPEMLEKLKAAQRSVFKFREGSDKEGDLDRVVVVGGGVSSGKEGERDNSMLRLSKSFKGESISTIKKFSVNANYTGLNLQLNGEVKTGVISITLIKPNGNIFKTIDIDATSDVSFNQSLDFRKNPAEWTGDWQIKIKADKVEGNYRLIILTK